MLKEEAVGQLEAILEAMEHDEVGMVVEVVELVAQSVVLLTTKLEVFS